jgi:quercetin dioxygenase-like cupin family protein
MIRVWNRWTRWGVIALTALAGVATGWSLRSAAGKVSLPSAETGMSRQPGPEVDLGPDLAGYKLRMTTVAFAPGGMSALHDPKQRPEVGYILEGKLTEHQKGAGTHEYAAGMARVSGRDAEHWLENRGLGIAKQVVVSLVKSQ